MQTTKVKNIAKYKELENHMDGEYQIVYLEKPEWATIGGGIHDHNTLQVGESNEQNLCFVLQGR